MPDWLITALLVAVLTWLTWKTFQKGWQLHCSELETECTNTASRAGEATQIVGSDDVKIEENQPDGDGVSITDIPTDTYNTVSTLTDEDSQLSPDTDLDPESGEVVHINGQEHQQPAHLSMCIPWRVIQFAELVCLWASFLGIQYGKVAFEQCSWQYAALCAGQAAFSAISTVAAIFQARRYRSMVQSELDQPLLSEHKTVISHHDWPFSKLVRCVAIVLLGGTVAGMLGFGGGMILGPLMLEMSIHPLVTSATSSVMVLFSASAATFSFAVSGRLNYQYALVYGALCAVASILGVAIISTSVRRSGRGSRIVFTLALIIASGALMQAVFGGSAALHDIRTGRHLSFASLC